MMSDIAKCEGIGCSIANKCYRFRKTGNPMYQSYIIPDTPGSQCEYFIPNKEDDEKYGRKKDDRGK